MKSLIASAFAFLLVLFSSSLHAQSSGGGSSASCSCTLVPGDQSSGCYSTSNGLGNNPWKMSLVADILKQAKDYYSLSLGQMIQEYHDCRCSIMYLGGNAFRVSLPSAGACCIDVVANL